VVHELKMAKGFGVRHGAAPVQNDIRPVYIRRCPYIQTMYIHRRCDRTDEYMGRVKVKPDNLYICQCPHIFITLGTDKYNLNSGTHIAHNSRPHMPRQGT
jgi:hypothetical protein